jgi:hypothetical protein
MADPKDKGTRIRNRFFTTPNPLRPLSLTMKPLELDSPVVRAIEILKKIQVDKVVKSPEDIDFVIHVLGTGHDLYSPNFSKVLEDSEQKDNDILSRSLRYETVVFWFRPYIVWSQVIASIKT